MSFLFKCPRQNFFFLADEQSHCTQTDDRSRTWHTFTAHDALVRKGSRTCGAFTAYREHVRHGPVTCERTTRWWVLWMRISPGPRCFMVRECGNVCHVQSLPDYDLSQPGGNTHPPPRFGVLKALHNYLLFILNTYWDALLRRPVIIVLYKRKYS